MSIDKVMKRYGMTNIRKMICPCCTSERIIKVEPTNLEMGRIRISCGICWGWFDLGENMLPCLTCDYNFNNSDSKICDKCKMYGFPNYKLIYGLDKCDECGKEGIQLYLIPYLHIHPSNYNTSIKVTLAVCRECKNNNHITKEELNDLLKRIRKEKSIIYCDNCGNKIEY